MLNVSVRAVSLRAQPFSGSRCHRSPPTAGGPQPCGPATLGSWPWSALSPSGSTPSPASRTGAFAPASPDCSAPPTPPTKWATTWRGCASTGGSNASTAPTPTSSPTTANASRSSTPRCTTNSCDHCWPLTDLPHPLTSATPSNASTTTSTATSPTRACETPPRTQDQRQELENQAGLGLSLIHISEPTRLGMISYAVFCLKKKTNIQINLHDLSYSYNT